MSTNPKFVIIGAGLAGACAAETLRNEGFRGEISIIGNEPHRPYNRPPLSKQRLAGEPDEVFVHPSNWYDDHSIELRLESIARTIDPAGHTIALEGGEKVRYDRLLLATGASARRVTIPGAWLDGIHYLRTLEDSDELRELLKDGDKRVVVVGSGWIGMEVAASARMLGNDVTVLEVAHGPLDSALGSEVGQLFASLHADHGVDIRNRAEATEFIGVDGRVIAVRVADGQDVPADVVVVAIGASPNVALAQGAGLEVRRGILVDEGMHTSHPDIFAAGDVANAWHPFIHDRIRSDHWANAMGQGPAAAKSMLGQLVSYDEIPYFYTDQYDLGMEFAGFVPLTRRAKIVYRGDVAKREVIVFWILNGRVVAGMNVNVWGVNDEIKRIIRDGKIVDIDHLPDPAVDLATLGM
jgi:3-phenylpropionate/trans-cinnamate dioxygenase ferredoxin reductase subunit